MAFLSPGEVRLLREAGHPRTWVRGEVLMREGETADSVVLLTGGLVKATVDSANGYTSLLALRGPGELLGELACIDGRPRGATVTAMRRSAGLVVAGEAFLRLLERDPALCLAVLRSVVGRLRDSDGLRADQGARTTGARVAGLLVKLAVQYGSAAPETLPGAVAVQVNQRELASATGASRESVVRCLRAMQRAGLVATGRGRTVVLDLAGLRRWAEEE
ncbi:Crp/Fnr family transcriptional regulator [Streptomyces humi]|uniref:Crp/Fnr family transcriptional regulator n=1 Tax=Streptomyces humi TaxID=1428620 RepID=UPI0008FC2B30|nr:Crp/Fnr family transcriptional regulator [Streptomyces humi]